MATELFLHVRRLQSGRVVATPLPFTDLSVEGESLDHVRALVREAVASRLEEMPGVRRAAVLEYDEAELGSVLVKLSSGAGAEEVRITVGVVVMRRAASVDDVYVACAPGVPRWSLAGSSKESLMSASADSLNEELDNWPPGPAVALDQVGEVSLQRLSLASAEQQPLGVQIAGDDMVALAAEGRLGRLDRRDPLVDRVLAALAADGRASVLLVGKSDVGKTALIHEIAARIGSGDVPPGLVGCGCGGPRPMN